MQAKKIKAKSKKFIALLPLFFILFGFFLSLLAICLPEAAVEASGSFSSRRNEPSLLEPELSLKKQLPRTEAAQLKLPGQGQIPAGDPNSEEDAGSVRQKPLIEDEVGLLTDEEYDQLLEQLSAISKRHKCDVAVVTVYSLGGLTATDFADDYFDYNGYGYGEQDDGILLLLSMEYRDWAMSTHQFAIYAFDDYGLEAIFNKIKGDLGSNSYYSAFSKFAAECDYYLERARAGNPVRIHDEKTKKARLAGMGIAGLGFGGVGSTAPIKSMRQQLKSIYRQHGAGSYMNRQGRKINNSAERFIDRQTQVIPIPKPTNSASGSGGSSSTHRSSSGRTHGGSSGKF